MADGDREAPKLKMEHGFMKSIIKNQVDRDYYDKEQKMVKVQTAVSRPSPTKERAKRTPMRPAMAVYVPPHLRTEIDEAESRVSPDKNKATERRQSSTPGIERHVKHKSPTKQPEPLLLVEFKNKKGEICNLYIYKGDDVKRLVRDFASDNELTSKLRDALYYRVQQELSRDST